MPRSASRRIEIAAVVALALAAFAIRTIPAWSRVFNHGTTVFSLTDAWYHVRVAENAVANFPHVLEYDSFLLHPNGDYVPVAPLFPLMIATASWMLGAGHPSAQIIEHVAALTAPFLAALAVVVVWATARAYYERGALLAGAIIAFVPSEFFARSLLGDPDQHVAEVLFSTAALGLTIAALREVEAERPWMRLAIAGGVSLAAYLLVWRSSILLLTVFAAGLAFVIVFRDRNVPGDITLIPVIGLASAAVVIAPLTLVWSSARNAMFALLPCLGAFCLMHLLRRTFARSVLRSLLFVGVVGTAAILSLRFISPFYFEERFRDIHRLMPRREGMLVTEAVPLLLSPRGILAYIDNFGAAGVLALGGLAILLIEAWRAREAATIVFSLWSIVMFALAFAQIRFNYYLVVVIALLCGFLWARLDESGLSRARRRLAAIIVTSIIVLPAVTRSVVRARVPDGPSPAWQSALTWMRHSTPEPFANADAYDSPTRLPPSSYGVLAWWDFSYWIIRIGHRVPVTNATQSGAAKAAEVLLATDESAAISGMRSLGARYAIVDDSLPYFTNMTKRSQRTGSFLPAICAWANAQCDRFVATYTIGDSGTPMTVFPPDYFRALGVRLFLYGQQEARVQKATVLTVAPPRRSGEAPRIVNMQDFASYELASDFARGSASRRVVSLDPLQTCVPLPPLVHLSGVWSSHENSPSVARSAVQVFELR